MRAGHLHGALSRPAMQRQMDVLAAYVTDGGSVSEAARRHGTKAPDTLV